MTGSSAESDDGSDSNRSGSASSLCSAMQDFHLIEDSQAGALRLAFEWRFRSLEFTIRVHNTKEESGLKISSN